MPTIVSSDMSFEEATRWLAIHEHLVNRDRGTRHKDMKA